MIDVYKTAKEIAAEYDLREDTVLKMIRAESDSEQRDNKTRYTDSIGIACERIRLWLKDADEYAVCAESSVTPDELDDLADFVASHRTACVWAVLAGKARAAKANIRA